MSNKSSSSWQLSETILWSPTAQLRKKTSRPARDLEQVNSEQDGSRQFSATFLMVCIWISEHNSWNNVETDTTGWKWMKHISKHIETESDIATYIETLLKRWEQWTKAVSACWGAHLFPGCVRWLRQRSRQWRPGIQNSWVTSSNKSNNIIQPVPDVGWIMLDLLDDVGWCWMMLDDVGLCWICECWCRRYSFNAEQFAFYEQRWTCWAHVCSQNSNAVVKIWWCQVCLTSGNLQNRRQNRNMSVAHYGGCDHRL